MVIMRNILEFYYNKRWWYQYIASQQFLRDRTRVVKSGNERADLALCESVIVA